MKTRKNFVSNSSSSSFVCDVCGNAESGYDISLEDADMYECENGHTYCACHAVDKDLTFAIFQKMIDNKFNDSDDDYKEVREKIKTLDPNSLVSDCDDDDVIEFYEEFDDDRYETPSAFCPICCLDEIDPDDILRYVCLTHNLKKDDIIKEIRLKYPNHEELQKFIDTDGENDDIIED